MRTAIAVTLTGTLLVAVGGPAAGEYVHDIGRAQAHKHHPQWALRAINIREAWKVSTGAGVSLGLVDSGIGPTWELDGRIARQVDLAGRLTPRYDRVDHGTAVGCIAAASEGRPGRRGITGVAPDIDLHSARVFRRSKAPRKVVLRGIRWTVRQGVDVLNLSLTMKKSPALGRAIRAAQDDGVIVVAGVGNNGGMRTQRPTYPAAYPGVIGVGGVAPGLTAYSLSTRGEHVDVAAPAEDVLSCDPFGTLSYYDGTSYATPHVAAVAALLKSVRPGLTAERAEHILERTATDLGDPGWDPTFGHGLIDAGAALRELTRKRSIMSTGRPASERVADWSGHQPTTAYAVE